MTLRRSVGGRAAGRRIIRCSSQAAGVVAIRGLRHRHRHPARKAEDHLRGVPAGRCQRPAANTAAPGLGLAISRELAHAARRRNPACAARRAWAARSRSICRSRYVGPRALPRERRPVPRAAHSRDRILRRSTAASSQIADDRRQLEPATPILLIVEDDPHYARMLVGSAHETGASRFWSRRTAPMRSSSPSNISRRPISLDVFLPDMLGWTVLSQLKQNPLTRHIPGADPHAGRRPPARAWRAAPSPSSPSRRRPQGVEAALVADRGIMPAAAQAACWSSRTTRPSR